MLGIAVISLCWRNGYSIGLMVELSQSSQKTTSSVKLGMQNLQTG